MDLQNFDLNALTILLNASTRNPELKSAIESEIQRRMAENNKYSREYIFQVSMMQKHAIQVYFIPTTDAYKKYGEYVTVEMILSDEEIGEMVKNISSKPPINTSGQVKAKVLSSFDLSEEQIKLLETEGFHTSEILKTQHL
ncbi:hypothetical protein [Rufibacter latericius]|uniref:Uncharacterized protein n=1 Tax=Rufibacter latericius TaxID=2487040 RepID=A0A3M9MAS2_9BACT|nr:hypothetical protein [Rufibacter latericius]RNI22616.1 hypothetical protein EFB08_21205 [Rufibacter latericius]